MAELIIGQHCNHKECHSLDFLPLECNKCHSIFCKDHIYYTSHDCKCFNCDSSSDLKSSACVSYGCSNKGCKQMELIEIKCLHCEDLFCLQHRHPVDHNCNKMPLQNEDKKLKTAELVHVLTSNKVNRTKVSTTPLSAKSISTASKIALMKVKQKAIGDVGLPPEERVYMEIKYTDVTGTKSHFVFFDKQWSVGKCIDRLAKMLKIEYNNHVKKLRLFVDHKPDYCDELIMDKKLIELVSCGVLHNGGTLILKYI